MHQGYLHLIFIPGDCSDQDNDAMMMWSHSHVFYFYFSHLLISQSSISHFKKTKWPSLYQVTFTRQNDQDPWNFCSFFFIVIFSMFCINFSKLEMNLRLFSSKSRGKMQFGISWVSMLHFHKKLSLLIQLARKRKMFELFVIKENEPIKFKL